MPESSYRMISVDEALNLSWETLRSELMVLIRKHCRGL